MLFASHYLFAGEIETLLLCNNYPWYISFVQGKQKQLMENSISCMFRYALMIIFRYLTLQEKKVALDQTFYTS